jgi:ornithine--oxo-acid transaminase
MLAAEHDGARPDIVVLGKALSGGALPVAAVLADDAVMLTIGRGQHGSTYGGNPVAARVGVAALDVLVEERLAERAAALGPRLLDALRGCSPLVAGVRGRGLLCALVIDESKGASAWEVCLELMRRGLLSKPTHGNVIRLAPPLVISEEQLDEAAALMVKTLQDMAK